MKCGEARKQAVKRKADERIEARRRIIDSM
jgi:hypothetical protein